MAASYVVEECKRLQAENARLRAEVDRLRALMAGEDHILHCDDVGWAIQHPIACRPDLLSCPFNDALNLYMDGPPPEGIGRYVVTLDSDGAPSYKHITG
jgi:hypothetical protein